MTSQHIKVKVKSQPVVVMEAEVARKIRQHARTSMKAEVCGVLIGSMDNDRTVIEACIAGINAAQGGAHVTFTQDAWEHIYKIKDQQYPDEKIVGWYHSHPGFGVFLSEHDLFIQENFFSSPQQVAWVYDPHTDEEGCFGWVGGKTEKLSGIRTGYSQSVEVDGSHASEYEEDDAEAGIASQVRVREGDGSREPAWVRWASRTLGYLAVLFLGFALGHQYLAWRLTPDLRALEQMAQRIHDYEAVLSEPVVRVCVERFLRSSQFQGGADPGTPGMQSPQQAPQQAPQQPQQQQPRAPANAGKGTNGKH